jgi:hypothetical protein
MSRSPAGGFRAFPAHRRFRLAAIPLVLVVSAAVLLSAGCGGDSSSSETTANEAYADSVCTAVGTWEQQVKNIVTDFSGGLSKASLQSKLTQVEEATKTAITQIKAVPPPDTAEGQAAKQQLQQLSSDATTTIDAAKTTITQLQDNASVATITTAVAALAPQVNTLVSSAQSAISTLQSAKGSLGSAFKSTDSCQNLAPSSGS